MSKKEQFKKFVEKIQSGRSLVVYISMPDLSKPEMIINQYENIDKKLEYYLKAYNDDLKLISFPSIEIVNYCAVRDNTNLGDIIDVIYNQ